MVRTRALFLLTVLPIVAFCPSQAEATGGIQISPVMVAMTTTRHIASVVLRNGRDQPVSFEAEAYIWSQDDGEDTLTPTREIIIAPGVFEIPAGGQQVVRLGLMTSGGAIEQSYRLVLRELPSPAPRANGLGFTLELSLPVFVTPIGARPDVSSRVESRALVLTNAGAAHAQIISVEDTRTGALRTPRYLLAGTSATIAVDAGPRVIQVSTADAHGARSESTIHVPAPGGDSSGR